MLIIKILPILQVRLFCATIYFKGEGKKYSADYKISMKLETQNPKLKTTYGGLATRF